MPLVQGRDGNRPAGLWIVAGAQGPAPRAAAPAAAWSTAAAAAAAAAARMRLLEAKAIGGDRGEGVLYCNWGGRGLIVHIIIYMIYIALNKNASFIKKY
jgi:hypothetical protein